MCSLSVYGPSLVIAPTATRVEIAIDCQNEKKRIPFTQRNFGTGLNTGIMNLGRQEASVNSPKWLQIIVYTHPEHCEAIKCKANGHVIHD